MVRRSSSLLLSLLLVAQVSHSGPALLRLKSMAGSGAAGLAFDGARPRERGLPPSPVPAFRASQLDERTLEEVKELLSHGTELPDGAPIMPFTFRMTDGGAVTAPTAGLEGFVFAEHGVAAARGRQAVAHHLGDYFLYLDALLAPVIWAEDARAHIRGIRDSGLTPQQKYERLMAFVAEYTEALRRVVARSDASTWVRTARIYEIFPRAYNLAGKRAARDRWDTHSGGFFADFGERDLRDIRARGFDTIWVMGIFPIGERNRAGTGGGSPYSIKDHAGVNPELGTPDEFRAFVARAHAAGLRVIIDFVPNHTAMDSKLLNAHPDYFVHREADPGRTPPDGYFSHRDSRGRSLWMRHGGFLWGSGRSYWIDTAQVDYSNPYLRREMIRIVKGWAGESGVDGFRVDMAYLVLNDYFDMTWGWEKGGPMPEREFLEELITEVKAQYPGTAFLAESYDRWDDLSEAGFDLIYGKNDMARPGGHHGWYDALASRDPGRIREAVKRAGYLHWQKGGAGVLSFVGNHDEVSPQRAFGEWLGGAAFLTLLLPGGVLFYGSQEIGFDRPSEREHKSIPFDVPVSVDWEGADQDLTRFHNETFRLASRLHDELGEADIDALPWEGDPPWVGYLLKARNPGSLRAAAVLANPTGSTVEVRYRHPELGIDYAGTLPPYGYDLVTVI